MYSFKGCTPVVHEFSLVVVLEELTGIVTIGKNCYIGPGAAIRGDWGQIIIKDGVNIQENCTVHIFPGKSITLKESAHVGHGAIIHGANLGRNCLIGMNTVIMDDAEIGDESIVGAMAFVKAETIIPKRSLVVGNPAKVIKQGRADDKDFERIYASYDAFFQDVKSYHKVSEQAYYENRE